MTSSSIPRYFFPTPNIHFRKRTTTKSSYIPSPKRRTCRRKNHLRPKIPTKPQTQTQDLIQTQLVFYQESLEEATELVQEDRLVESESFDPVLASGQGWLPGSEIGGLALRFAALLAVQTAVALLIFGSRKADEEVAPAVAEEEARARVSVRKWESEEVVEEIREMVKEAREREAEEADEEGDGIRGEIRREIPRLTKSLAKDIMDKKESSLAPKGRVSTRKKRVGLVKLNTRIRDAPKGFNGSNNREEDITIIDAADSYQNPANGSQNLYESRGSSAVNSKLVEKVLDVDDYSILPFGSLSYADELHISTQRKVEESNSDNILTSLVNNYPKQSGMKIEKSFIEGTSIIPNYINGKSDSGKDGEETKSKFQKHEDYNSIPRNGPWWMELPFVLAILLRRGSDRNGPKGLYSLKMESPSEDGGSSHYTIVFQDQNDATNFCYLLESFFEDLDDFSADVVPLTIHELEERVGSSEMKVIVVKKGQVQLYAGQPLAEVENLLRSLID